MPGFARSVAVALVFALIASVGTAQQNAALRGTVTDESKAVLPGFTVTAADVTSGVQQATVTNERGEYALGSLPPGRYALLAELSGFSASRVQEFELLVGQNATLPLTLKVGTLEESITVTSEPVLIDLHSSQVAGNTDRRQMEALPLQPRNWMELAMIVQGITANDVTDRPGVLRDTQFQLNLDGQQITQSVASSGFGQPRFS